MIKFLIRKFIKNYENTNDTSIREKYSLLSGILGIICNVILFIIKLTAGILMKSITVISDSFNNLSDTASSVITIIGTKMSNLSADKEHPFGHGRIEYISSLIVSFMIILVGFELLKSSFSKILAPSKINLNFTLVIILLITVFIKIWMFLYNRYMARKINSSLLMATSTDSKNDVIVTLAVILSTVADGFIPFSIDGYTGTLISLYIIYSGYKISKDAVTTLLGTPPDKSVSHNIKNIILENEIITGVHDLMIHDYGPGRTIASVHAEVPSNCDILKIHDVIDQTELKIEKELGVHIVIHMDPVITDCEKTNHLKSVIISLIKEINPDMSIHDFRISEGKEKTNLLFDLCVPSGTDEKEQKKITEKLNRKIKQIDKRCNLIIKIDYLF